MSANLLPLPSFGAVLGSTPVSYPAATDELELKLTLRSKLSMASETAALASILQQLPHQRRYLTHEELAAATGADPADLAALEAYFQPFGINVTSHALLSKVVLTGSTSAFEKAFNAELAFFQGAHSAQELRPTTPLKLPAQLLPLVQGLAPAKQAVRKEWRLPIKPMPARLAESEQSVAPAQGYSPATLAKAYQFPDELTGAGQVIGLVELTAGLNRDDLTRYFAQMGVAMPEVVEVGTPPAASTYATEMTMDLQIAGGLAPQARLVVYYGTTLAEALQAIVSDKENNPSVISCSWGGSELNYTAQEVLELNVLLYQASLLGITFVAGSADQGALNGLSTPNVSLPSSSPLVLGCGGTTATITTNVLTGEVVWYEVAENDPNRFLSTGGGYSGLYPQPYYQATAVARYPYQKTAMRGVPDLAADASLDPGYQVMFDGQATTSGGTSAATPLVAALLARLNEKLGYRLGFLNPVLYALAGSPAFRAITQGNNGVYAAAPYWNPCTGLGSPVGTQLLNFLQQLEHTHAAAPSGTDAPPPNDK